MKIAPPPFGGGVFVVGDGLLDPFRENWMLIQKIIGIPYVKGSDLTKSRFRKALNGFQVFAPVLGT